MLKFLDRCQKAYTEGEPLITDDEFDYLANKYDYYELGYTATSDNKVGHIYNMYSLKKVFDEDESNPSHLLKYPIITPKLDGAAIELVYNEGFLLAASSRGDGDIGDDIYDNAETLNSIPISISYTGLLQVTGEIVAPKEINNARNYAAGALHLKDPEEFNSRDLTFIAYGMIGDNGETYIEDMNSLHKQGFNTVNSKAWDQFPQDGLVYRENMNSIYNAMGHTSKHPRGAFAYKKRGDVEIKETKLLSVDWQIGKGRKVTPVAHFEPIIIDDATITKATLHNAGFVEELDLSIGDTLLVTRSGGVIPKVVGKL